MLRKAYPTVGCCGLDCGMCPRFYTAGHSRCPGCAGPDFFNKHPSCSFITCCVKKHGLEACGQCPEFPCPKFKTNEEHQTVQESSSYPSYRKAMPNLNFIKENGIEQFIQQQTSRIRILLTMIRDFDDGRSKSFFCKAATLLDLASLTKSLSKAARQTKAEKVTRNDLKKKAQIFKQIINETALEEGVELAAIK